MQDRLNVLSNGSSLSKEDRRGVIAVIKAHSMQRMLKVGCAAVALTAIGSCRGAAWADETKIPIVFSGGHETDRRDGGRPVVLVAAGLGVSPELFREAFRGVTPARGGPPSRAQAQRNKRALLKVLGPHGVTNERLDEVSDYYRYRPERGELWRCRPARAQAIVKDGRVTRIEITEAGAGYSSPPKATVQGFEKTPLEVKLHFDKDVETNGSITAIEIATEKESAKSPARP